MSQLTVQQALSILQLQPGATDKQIRAAYKRLALKLHPDKHRQQKQRQSQPHEHHSNGPANAADATAAFSLLSAAYDLLTGQQHHSVTAQHTQHSTWPSFEAAYASGSLFNEQLIDQAVVTGASPADVAHLQQLCAAAAAGQLAQQLQQRPPTPEDEQLWRQLHKQLTLEWQLQQLQQQQQHAAAAEAGVGLGELLSDLFFKAKGQIMVDVTDEETESEMEHDSSSTVLQQQQQQQQAVSVPADLQSSQQIPAEYKQQPQEDTKEVSLQRQAASSLSKKKRQRHGLGFYWLWFRRLLVAKAVWSVLVSRPRQHQDVDFFDLL